MSAIIVLILRILMVASIYGFLVFALLAMWRELKKSSEQQAKLAHPRITISIDGEGKQHFSQPEILIGRGMENDIRFVDDAVSHQHARIYYFNNNWLIEDSRSTNGTFLNGEVIHSPTVLIDEDLIGVGSKTLRITLSDSSEST